MPTQNQITSLHNTSSSHLRICQYHLGPTYSLQYIQPPISTNLRQYNAAQPDTSCSRHASVTTMLQHLYLPTLQQRRQHSKIIMLYRITHKVSQHSNRHLHRTIHSKYSTLHPALCPHTCIQNIFLPKHHTNMEQPTTCHNQQHNHTTT